MRTLIHQKKIGIKPPEICIDLHQPEVGCPHPDHAQRLIPELGCIVEDRVISRMLVFAMLNQNRADLNAAHESRLLRLGIKALTLSAPGFG